jgi:hypothetical protein
MLTIYEGYFGLSSMHLRVTKDVLVHVAQPMYRKKSLLLLDRVLDDQTREDLDVKNVQVHVPFRAVVPLHQGIDVSVQEVLQVVQRVLDRLDTQHDGVNDVQVERL